LNTALSDKGVLLETVALSHHFVNTIATTTAVKGTELSKEKSRMFYNKNCIVPSIN
jgi:hypothetical protein